MNKQQIKELALENGFNLKEQPDGTLDLNPYVYDFAAALKAQWHADILAEISPQVSASKPVAWLWKYRGFVLVTASEAKAIELQEDPENEVTPLYAIPEQVKAKFKTESDNVDKENP